MATDTIGQTILYRGVRRAIGVQVTHEACPTDDRAPFTPCDLPPRLDLACHSTTGFEWGYGGSGPAQLALALLADAVGDEMALAWYPAFKRRVVARLPSAGWQLSQEELRQMVQQFRCDEPEDEPLRAAAPQP